MTHVFGQQRIIIRSRAAGRDISPQRIRGHNREFDWDLFRLRSQIGLRRRHEMPFGRRRGVSVHDGLLSLAKGWRRTRVPSFAARTLPCPAGELNQCAACNDNNKPFATNTLCNGLSEQMPGNSRRWYRFCRVAAIERERFFQESRTNPDPAGHYNATSGAVERSPTWR